MGGQSGWAATFPSQFQPAYPQQSMFDPTAQAYGAAPNRKRRADSPPNAFAWAQAPHETKRRRPNLHNGFASMSITPRPEDGHATPLPHPAMSRHPPADVDGPSSDSDDGLEPTGPPPDGDVAVEVLSDKHASPTRRKRPLLSHRHSSFSSTSPSEEDDYESDVTFRPPQERERLRQAHPPMQATSVEHPSPDLPSPEYGTPTVEPFESPLKRKHLLYAEDEPNSKRQRPYMDMDGDVGMDAPVASGPGWYEPEKDRIVVTSLSSPEGSPGPRSPSPDPGPKRPYSYDEHRHLAQPGQDGFTISPSLLTHIMAAQSDQFRPDAFASPSFASNPERGLVLYRPLGIPAAENVVKQWGEDDDDGRFEAIDDDENAMDDSSSVVGVPLDINGAQFGGGGGAWGAGAGEGFGTQHNDDAMDMDMDIE